MRNSALPAGIYDTEYAIYNHDLPLVLKLKKNKQTHTYPICKLKIRWYTFFSRTGKGACCESGGGRVGPIILISLYLDLSV